MTVRRIVLALGAVLLIAGVIGLLVPVSITDGNGNSIGCGNALVANTQSARNAMQQTNNQTGANIPVVGSFVPHSPDYVAQCQSSVGSRRAWAIPLAVLGVIAIGATLLTGRRGAAPGV